MQTNLQEAPMTPDQEREIREQSPLMECRNLCVQYLERAQRAEAQLDTCRTDNAELLRMAMGLANAVYAPDAPFPDQGKVSVEKLEQAHPGTALLSELARLREVAGYARHKDGCSIHTITVTAISPDSPRVDGNILACSCGLSVLLEKSNG